MSRRINEHARRRLRSMLLAIATLLSLHEVLAAVLPDIPVPECRAHAGDDRDRLLPGYLLPTARGVKECIPFTSTAVRPPKGYAGKDFYVDEFTDQKLRERWVACKAEKACFGRVSKMVNGLVDALGRAKTDRANNVKDIRRPASFKTIAELEARTSTIELTAPAEPFERIYRQQLDPVKLRGWFVRGDGIDDGNGGKVRSLVIMSGADDTRLAEIDNQAFWRRTLYQLNRAGFDVLAYDRRGVGISGGASDSNTLQQGRDLLDGIAALRSGEGLRVLTASGEVLEGRGASAALLAGAAAESMPILLLGYSQGTMATSWAMTINFDKNCSYDLSSIVCLPPRRIANIKGAILLAEFASGAGYGPAEMVAHEEARGYGRDRGLYIGAGEGELNLALFPSSATLAGVHTWPAAFFARGLWDHATSLEGTVRTYGRVKGLRELVVVRGPHAFDAFPEKEQTRVTERMIAFARAAALGERSVPGGRAWSSMKDLVGTTRP